MALEEYICRREHSSLEIRCFEIEQPLKIIEDSGWGQMNIDRKTGDALHIGHDGTAHIDIGPEHWPKLEIEKNDTDRYGNPLDDRIKSPGGYW